MLPQRLLADPRSWEPSVVLGITSPAVTVTCLEAGTVKVMPPASELNVTDPAPVPWLAETTIVSLVPASASILIALAASSPETIPTPPTSDTNAMDALTWLAISAAATPVPWLERT